MLRIIRAEDGQDFQLNASLRDIEASGSLESFLHHVTGIEPEAVLAYISDGQRLTNSNLRELAGSSDQTIYLFNKYYLDYDLEQVVNELRVNAPLLPPVEETISATPPFRPAQLAISYLRAAHVHNDHISGLYKSLVCQNEAMRIASSSLDLNVLSIIDIFDAVAVLSRKELDKQAILLAGISADLDLISRVKVHVDFVSSNARRAIESGDKPRTLGDYVSNVKMMQVAETCGRTHEDLRQRFITLEERVNNLKAGADSVRAAALDVRQLEAAESNQRHGQETYDRIAECAEGLEGPNPQSDVLVRELKNLDTVLRSKLQSITDIKNSYTAESVAMLQRLSLLNTEMVELSPEIIGLQASFRGKNSFLHIQRLHNMLYAYGATIIEIVRRREFGRFFYQRAQSVLEVMAKLTVSERKRRQIYRSELHGQLPFETRGMDDPVPTVDFSPIGSSDSYYSLERSDVDAFLHFMDELDQVLQTQNDTIALTTVRECRAALDKLVQKMDSIESGFDRIAEKSLLSSSRLSSSRRKLSVADEQAYQTLLDQVHSLEKARVEESQRHEVQEHSLQDELLRVKEQLEVTQAELDDERSRRSALERDLQSGRVTAESESTSRRIMQDRLTEATKEADNRRAALEKALSENTEQAKTIEMLRQELAQMRAEYGDIKALEERNNHRMSALIEEQSLTLRRLEEARARGEDLRSQIQAAQTENEQVNRALQEVGKEKDRLLRAQAIEHDRIMRDHMVEMDGDRAILEHQFLELKAVLESVQEQLRDAVTDADVAHSDAAGLREELQRIEHELKDAKQIERLLREETEKRRNSNLELEQRLEVNERLLASILDVALTFRDSHIKALNWAHAVPVHSSRQLALSETVFSNGLATGQAEEPAPIDPSDPAAALEALRSYDHDHFLEVISKAISTIRKWQKQCKEYRERAKGKISFRNFAKGDLALFLPTRNSISKPWAAFNVSFPHYFLQATGHLAEQLKTREWIVARITSITERVVNQNVPDSNPYGLGEGVKYYMLEVEDWTQPVSQKRHTSSRRVTAPLERPLQKSTTPPDLPTGPPENAVEEAFRATRPPTSDLFPVRKRSSSSPSARPSSLSRLLAQATLENQAASTSAAPPTSPAHMASAPTLLQPPESVTESETSPPPTTSPSSHPSTVQQTTQPVTPVLPAHPSPLRPGSRASRMSSSSRYSAGLIPGVSIGTTTIPKAVATTAITEQPFLSTSPIPQESGATVGQSPAPTSLMNIFGNSRRRVSSFNISPNSPLGKRTIVPPTLSTSPESISHVRAAPTTSSALANLASWGVSLGRKRRNEAVSRTSDIEESSVDGSQTPTIGNDTTL